MFAAFNENRTFGVEIEILDNEHNRRVNYTRQDIADALNAAGINAQTEGYNHCTRRHWKVITDCTCGFEVVSPVLKGQAGLDEVNKVCEVLNNIGARVDKSCGLHVHHGVSDYTLKNFKNLYILYAKHEEAIDQIVPPSRRDNSAYYTQSLYKSCHARNRGIRGYEDFVSEINKTKCVNDIRTLMGDRYRKLNIESYVKYSTIEFRHFGGSTDGEKITNWIILTQLMVTKGFESVNSKIKEGKTDYNTIEALTWVLNMHRKPQRTEQVWKVCKYFEKRAKDLNANNTNRIAA